MAFSCECLEVDKCLMSAFVPALSMMPGAAAKRGGRGGSAGRGAKRKPTVKDRLAKKLRLG